MPRSSVTVVLRRNSRSDNVLLSAGNAPPFTRALMPSALWHAYSMKRYDASGLRERCSTASADPPFSDVVALPSCVGICATRHKPAVPGRFDISNDGNHAPENMEAIFPSPTASFHSSDHAVRLVSTNPSSIIFCQNSVKVLVPSSSVRLIVTFLPSFDVENGRPPASQIIVS